MSSLRVRLAKLRMLAPLGGRDFRILWVGMVASLLGDGVFLVAVAWEVYSLSNSPAELAVIGIATTLPQVLLLLAGGVFSDRFDRRMVMIGADVARGAAIGMMGVLAVSGALTLPAMVVLVALYGAGSAFFGPAFDALVPLIVSSEQLTEANALDGFMRPAALRLAGPMLGGLLVASAGAGFAFLLDAATFAFSALCVRQIASHARGSADVAAEPMSLKAVQNGLQFIRGHVWLWGTFAGAAVSYLLFIGPSEVLLPFVIKNNMDEGARTLGLVFAAGGVGALLAAGIAGQHGMPRHHITLMYVTWAIATLAVAGYGLAVASWELAAACFLFNALEAAGTVWWATAKGRLVPSSLLGRVSSVDWFISTALVPLSYALTAPVAATFGVRETLIGVGALGSVTTLLPLFLRGMREVERSGLALDAADPITRARQASPA